MPSGPASAATGLRILARPAFSNAALNPYNAIVYRAVQRTGVLVDEYAHHRWLFGRYDLLHVHWPESVFNHSLAEALVTTRSLLAAMRHMKQRGSRMLWTVHNLRAHERRHEQHEAAFFDEYIPLLDGIIALSQGGARAAVERFPRLADKPRFVVPHPHYRGVYPDTVDRAQARRALGLSGTARVVLFFGQVLDYKNVPTLVHAVRALPPGTDTVLVVAGKPRTAELWREVEAAAGVDPRIVLHQGRVPDERAQLYLRAADLVALPYREILNSGAALLAASFDRHVLLPQVGAGAELQAALGPAWVSLYDGPLTASVLQAALARAQALPERSDAAHLAPIDPDRIGRMTADAYAALCR